MKLCAVFRAARSARPASGLGYGKVVAISRCEHHAGESPPLGANQIGQQAERPSYNCWPKIIRQISPDPDNADAALQLLGVTTMRQPPIIHVVSGHRIIGFK